MPSEFLFVAETEITSEAFERATGYRPSGPPPYGADIGHGFEEFGARWWWFPASMRDSVADRIGAPLVARWERSGHRNSRYVFTVPPSAERAVDDGDGRIRVLEPFAPAVRLRLPRLVPILALTLLPETTRAIVIEAPDAGALVTEFPDLGVFRVCLDTGFAVHERPVRVASMDHGSVMWHGPSGAGRVIYEGDTPLAELVEDHTLLVHADLVSSGDMRMATRVLAAATKLLGRENALREHLPSCSVRVGLSGGAIRELNVPEGASVERAVIRGLGIAPAKLHDRRITVNGSPCSPRDPVRSGDCVCVA